MTITDDLAAIIRQHGVAAVVKELRSQFNRFGNAAGNQMNGRLSEEFYQASDLTQQLLCYLRDNGLATAIDETVRHPRICSD